MTKDRWDALLDRDWSDAWETLPEAPDLVSRGESAQITLRLPATMLARVKRVASARALPYHTLMRSWIAEGLRSSVVPHVVEPDTEAETMQLNIKLDQAMLDSLKARAHELRQPYHRLARELVERETEQAEQALGLAITERLEMANSRRHVVPDGKGNWKVVKPGAKRASDVLPTQREAVKRAKKIVSNKGGGEVRIHGRDGRIRDSDTVAPGNDPNPPKDNKH